uniref:Uncharacterized protein n=1 Tax=Heterorhabditis bacteriophora TaxID=37862 RepID=A0A1I7WWL4_HETBA
MSRNNTEGDDPNQYVSTRWYRAPELLFSMIQYDTKLVSAVLYLSVSIKIESGDIIFLKIGNLKNFFLKRCYNNRLIRECIQWKSAETVLEMETTNRDILHTKHIPRNALERRLLMRDMKSRDGILRMEKRKPPIRSKDRGRLNLTTICIISSSSALSEKFKCVSYNFKMLRTYANILLIKSNYF